MNVRNLKVRNKENVPYPIEHTSPRGQLIAGPKAVPTAKATVTLVNIAERSATEVDRMTYTFAPAKIL